MAYTKNRSELQSASGRFRVASPYIRGTGSTQILQYIWNGPDSGVQVIIGLIRIDVVHPGATAHIITDTPGLIRIHKTSATPGGNVFATKVSKDSDLVSDSNVTVQNYGNSDAVSANSATNLTGAAPANNAGCLAQIYCPRLFTTQRYEMFDNADLLNEDNVVLRPGEGLMVVMNEQNAQAASQFFSSLIEWWEKPFVLSNAFEATGGTITTPGDGYKYWTFTSTDSINVSVPGDVQYLCVGGGGPGQRQNTGTGMSGGGGGGGVKVGLVTLPTGLTTITVAGTTLNNTSTAGSNSSIGSLVTALGGQRGAKSTESLELDPAGNGGGGATSATTLINPGPALEGGYAGGNAFQNSTLALCAGGGGGGAGQIGGTATQAVGGNGGNGRLVWGNYYGGGGGGASAATVGTGGLGGGGNATNTSQSAGNGADNTGGGGGSSYHNTSVAGHGGSGIVILRRPI